MGSIRKDSFPKVFGFLLLFPQVSHAFWAEGALPLNFRQILGRYQKPKFEIILKIPWQQAIFECNHIVFSRKELYLHLRSAILLGSGASYARGYRAGH